MVFPLPVGLPLSVYDNVAYAPRMAGMRDRAELDELVEKCLRQAALWDEVKDRMRLLGTKLSGGQQQRLTLARALSHRPEILCLDEFSIAVDPVTTMKIEDVLLELKQEMTIVLVTNLVQQAQRLADHVAFSERLASWSRSARPRDLLRAPGQPAHVRLRAGTLRMTRRRPRPAAYSIDTQDLNLWYGDFQALKNVIVNIRAGLITALIGPRAAARPRSCAASTASTSATATSRRPAKSRILGKNIYDADVSLGELRKTVGMVFQRPNPLPISIYENVVFGLRVHAGGDRSKRAGSTSWSSRRSARSPSGMTSRTGCTEGHGLTLEQQQKLCIARLLPLKPQRDPDGRALLGARRRGHRGHRAADGRPAREVHDRHRHAQHGAGPPGER